MPVSLVTGSGMIRIPNINLLSDEWMSLWYRTKACLWNVNLLNNGFFPKTHHALEGQFLQHRLRRYKSTMLAKQPNWKIFHVYSTPRPKTTNILDPKCILFQQKPLTALNLHWWLSKRPSQTTLWLFTPTWNHLAKQVLYLMAKKYPDKLVK